MSAFPEVQYNLFGLFHIDAEVVFSAPTRQLFNVLPIYGLTVVDAAHQCRVIRKLHNMTVGVFHRAVMCQQAEQEGAQHTAYGELVQRVMVGKDILCILTE